MMNIKWKILLVLIMIVQVTFAQTENINSEVQTFSLEEAKAYAIENSFSTKSAKIDVEIAEQVVKETIATGLPQISATADYQNMLDLPVSLIPGEVFGQPGEMIEASFGTQHNSSFGVTLNQLIFSGEYIVGLQATKIYKDISVKQNKKTEKGVKESIAKAYYLALVSDKNLNNIDSSLTNLNVLVEETTELYNKGFADDIAVDQLVLTKRNIELSREMLVRIKEVSLRLLKFQMGIEYNTEIVLSDKLEQFIDVAQINSMLMTDFNVNNNIDFEITELNVVVNQNLLKYEKSSYLPTLSGFLSYSKNGMNNNFSKLYSSNWYPTTVAGLQLNIPIFSSGSKRSKVKQASLKLNQAEVVHEQTIQALHTEAIQKKSDLKTSLNTFMYQKENMVLSQKIYDKTLIKYKQGMASNMDLTQVQNQYLSTQSAYFNSIIEMLNKKEDLVKLIN